MIWRRVSTIGFRTAPSNHDDPSRAATRFGGGETGRRRSLALSTLLAGLPGMCFVYQGEELGLEDGDLDPDEMRDSLAVRNAAPELGRDPVRTPFAMGFRAGRWLHLQSPPVAAVRATAGDRRGVRTA